MRMKINLDGFLDEVDDMASIPYLLKLYLLDIEKMPIHIDPRNPKDTSITSEFGDIDYEYIVNDTEFSILIDFKPFVGL